MRTIAIVALCIGAFGLLACGGGGSDDTPDAFVIVTPDGGSGTDGGSTGACNPVEQTGCDTNEKCTFIWDTADLGHTGCAPNGTVAANEACEAPDTGYDNCVAGTYCLRGTCATICNAGPPDTCASIDLLGKEWLCSGYAVLFEDAGEGVGLCNPKCDPVYQDCPDGYGACYLQLWDGMASCAGIPENAVGVGQDDPCYGPATGGCYLNGCDEGYGLSVLTQDSTAIDGCAFYCTPADNWSGNATSLSGDAAGIQCTYSVGDRPNGPGAAPGFQCVYHQSFWGEEYFVEDFGFCNSSANWGSCADFDWSGLQADINALPEGESLPETYCDDNPNKCMVECISFATFDAAFPEGAPGGHEYRDFLGPKARQMMLGGDGLHIQ